MFIVFLMILDVIDNRDPCHSNGIFKEKNKSFTNQETNIAMEVIEENEPVEYKIVQWNVEDNINCQNLNTEVNSNDIIFQDKNVSFIE